MARLRRRHGKVLTRLSLHRDAPLSDSRTESEELAERIDEALDDACASMRFPRPRVLLSFGST
jgi:diaminopimelate decarboxylase